MQFAIRSILSLHHLHKPREDPMHCKDVALKDATSLSLVQIDPSSLGSDSSLNVQHVIGDVSIVQPKGAPLCSRLPGLYKFGISCYPSLELHFRISGAKLALSYQDSLQFGNKPILLNTAAATLQLQPR